MNMISMTSEYENHVRPVHILTYVASVADTDWTGGNSYYSSLEEGKIVSMTCHLVY